MMIKDWSRTGMYLGVGAIGAGFILIFLGWIRASGVDHTPGQIPYLISGGIGGLALVMVGSIVILVQNARKDRAALQRELANLAVAMERGSHGAGVFGDEHLTLDGMVIAGSSSFHLPTCHLVQNREEAEAIPRAVAEERGLDPCRICKP